ncbi:NAD(P)H-binding protein [Nocardia sp. CA2R105]|uniref:NAD(P)H-binding protein n=1 Tax=Nocardia coffeae TaxID=2873381 RepID=UPI001CA6EEBD|nr:NAD(P)H-binding protein [Nocardia coffeae]MBY8857002.1 NAD(P)H-binding protein [Nocardia coffeae]
MIVITTPTGKIGSRVLEIVVAQQDTSGEKVRVIVRDPGRLPEEIRDRIEVVTGSHGDREVLDRAFAGADAVFWLAPSNSPAPSLEAMYTGFTRPAAEAFVTHGVGHVVTVSALGRGTAVAGRAGHVTASLAMGDLIAGAGVAHRALANPAFMDNLLRQVNSIRDRGVFTDTVDPDHRLPTVATRDIGAVGARLLLDRSWTGTGEVPVLGPADLSPNDMAHTMSDVLGRPIRYERQSFEQLRDSLTGHGLPEPIVQGYLDMMRAVNDGLNEGVPRTPENTTPTSFREWCDSVLAPAVRA